MGTPEYAEVVPPPDAGPPRKVLFLPWTTSSGDVAAVFGYVLSEAAANREAVLRSAKETEASRLHAEIARIRRDAASRYSADRLVGVGPCMQRIRAQIEVAGQSSAVLSIIGPVCAGRSRIARAVSHFTPRGTAERRPAAESASLPLVPLDSAVLGAELLQSTIRGMVRTAQRRPIDGRHALAHRRRSHAAGRSNGTGRISQTR
ncbi:MAG: hypothetical protein QM775_05600 [Pirellulales bacterium]